MYRNNGKRILTISVICIIALILIFLGLYVVTDIFKSEKEMFFKYAMQLIEDDEENKLSQYFEKQQQQPYKNNGNIMFDVTLPDENVKKVNDINITFKGNIYRSQQKRQQDITLNYNEDINFPITFRQDKEFFGIQTKYIGSKYVAIENNNLNELYEKLGMTDVVDIPNKIDFEKLNTIKFTDEEKETLTQKYKEVLNNELTKEQFSKSQNTESTIYTLELTPDEVKDIIKTLLETIKTDDIILGKLNNLIDEELLEDDFDKLFSEIDGLDIDENIKIQVYEQNKKLNKIVVGNGSEFKITFSQRKDGDAVQYILTITITETDIETTIYIRSQYTGLYDLENIKEEYTIKIDNVTNKDSTSFKYNIKNNVSFDADTAIEGINEENAIILNNQSDEVVINLMEAIKNRMIEVNESQMQELGVEINPLIYANPIKFLGVQVFNLKESIQ